MASEVETVRKSRRVQRLQPEILGMATQGGRTNGQNEAELVDNEGHNFDEIFENASVVSRISQKSKTSKYSSAASNRSQVRRQKIELELKSMERLKQMEEELEKAELERRKIEREIQLEKRKMELEKALIDDDSTSDDSIDGRDDGKSQKSEGVKFSLPKEDKDTSVQVWVDRNEPVAPTSGKDGTVLTHLAETNSRLDRMMCRQTINKELPFFSGEPEEWPIFMMQYWRTTELCGLTDDENVLRLQKALKGKAREAVLPILSVPNNVGVVMESLELMFGRCEQIIDSMVAKVTSSSPVEENRPDSLITFSNLISNLVATMKSLKSMGHLWNPTLMKEIVMRLPINLQYRWCEKRIDMLNEPSIEDLSIWLKKVAMTASLIPVNLKSLQFDKKKKPVLTAVTPNVEKSACKHCNSAEHNVTKCKKFENDNIDKRWKTVKDNQLCFSCLAKGHRTTECTKKVVCGIDSCDRVHHKLLHKTKEVKATPSAAAPFVGHTRMADVMKDTLLRVIPVKVSGPGGEVETFALLDEGATISMVDQSLAKQLNVNGPVQSLCMQWTNGMTREERNSERVSLGISGVAVGARKFSLHGVRTVKELNLPSQSVDMELIKSTWPFLSDIPFSTIRNIKPLILIGSDNILLTAARELRHGQWNQPVASKTWLGWVVHGNLTRPKPIGSLFSFVVCEERKDDEELNQLIRDSYSNESFGVTVLEKPRRSKEDERALAIMKSTTFRIEGGIRFQTGLLWREGVAHLPESRNNALRRLHCMEKKMDRNETFAKEYCNKVEEFISKGYCRKLTPAEAATVTPRIWYIPHFAVFNPNKPGKLRLVFDAAAKSHGISLNECLLKGPDLLNPLPAVLMRFRKPKISIMGDIKEMFPQVKIIEADVQSQRFLWRGKERDQDPDVYIMDSMIFGAACSPSSALYVKNLIADEFRDEFPNVYEAIVDNTYMDDLLDGADNEEEAFQKIRDCIEVFRRGGFTICNWSCNSRNVVQMVPSELRAKDWVSLEPDSDLPVERVLGLRWNPEKDDFVFQPQFHKVNPAIIDGAVVPTKRELLRLVMSIFDPLGFIGHFTIKARVLFQQLWLSKLGWDDRLDADKHASWMVWLTELKKISEVHIPRCYSGMLSKAQIQMHVYCDASQQAFAACCYLRFEHDGVVDTAFVSSKTRVAPTKPLTIPRLELQAALMGARLAHSVREEIRVDIREIYFWSDSKTVISWIRAESHKFKQFVANRVGEILELTDVKAWRWVPTDLNVADDATRADKPTDFNPEGRWFRGPEFLRQPESDWPKEPVIELTVSKDEFKKEFTGVHAEVIPFQMPDPARFSSFLRTVRTTAWVCRFIKNYAARLAGKALISGELTANELEVSKRIWFKSVQRECFSDEIKRLKQGEQLDSKSRLLCLSPFLSDDGLLRVRGRLENASELSEATKHPIILDPTHPLTQLLCSDAHVRCAHQGVETVLNTMRQSFWILGMRAAVKRAFWKCQVCKVRKATPSPPLMASLPPERLLVQSRPFSYVGVDYFGPLMVTVGRKTAKRYGVLFTCLSVRAIHLEIAKDLSADSTINALRRFIARRLTPTRMLSDNGTNFHGANREIQESVRNMDQDQIQRECASLGIEWHFIPPASPHMGGSWERLIKSVKVALRATLLERAPQEETLHTLLIEAEFIVNSRPLTHVSVDPQDPESLTPNHFLHAGWTPGASFGEFDDDDLCRRRQWRQVQRMSDIFWVRWVKEYLPTLIRRKKWNKEGRIVKIDDVVLIVDKDGPRNSWPLGRVICTYPGKDGRVRVVDVKTKDGVFRRPVIKICVLDVRSMDEEN